jgi:hypothetical protein
MSMPSFQVNPMPARTSHPAARQVERTPRQFKLRPASQSYLMHAEVGVVAAIACVCGALVYAGVWLVRLLG